MPTRTNKARSHQKYDFVLFIFKEGDVKLNIVYRKANLDDAYGIAYVSAYSWKETYTGLLPDDYLANRISNIDKSLDSTKKFIEEHPNYFVAALNNKIVGICNYDINNNDTYKDYGHIGALYVLKEYQNVGIGKELFKIAVEGLIELGYDKMYLECMVGNDSINFYTKYLGEIDKTIDFLINNVGNVKADIVIFEDLNEVYKKLLSKGRVKE